MEKYVMVIDEGTTGTRALLYDKDFHIAGQVMRSLHSIHHQKTG